MTSATARTVASITGSREVAAQYSRLETQLLGRLVPTDLLVLCRRGEALINLPADDADHLSAAQLASVNLR